MNYNKKALTKVLATLNWATAQEGYTPGEQALVPSVALAHSTIVIPPLDPPSGRVHSERQRARLDKRRATSDIMATTRAELFAGDFDG